MENVGMAHALLATTQEACIEIQPWLHPQTGCMVVADSRLDNRRELVHALRFDRPEPEVGDCELIHAAWQKWNVGCADKLLGDFAVAIWDPTSRSLYLARDPMGVRPLLVHHRAGKLAIFASSSEAVIAFDGVPRGICEERIADALVEETEGIDNTSTFFRAITKVPPGCWTQLSVSGAARTEKYWEPLRSRPTGLPSSTGEWIDAQRAFLDRAVSRRLRSIRPVGSMLSGGLDSSSVVALASTQLARNGRHPLPVFSAVNRADAACMETRSIAAVLAATHTHCTEVQAIDHVSLASLDHWWTQCEEPFDGSISLAFQLYRAASAQGVVSLMDGVPADNLYVTGYPARAYFRSGKVTEAWSAAVDQWSWQDVQLPRFRALVTIVGCALPESIHSVRRRIKESRDVSALSAHSLAAVGFLEKVNMRARYRRYLDAIEKSYSWDDSLAGLSCASAPYITVGLERFNRVASICGVEPRPPFTDRELIEFAAWIPLRLRLSSGYPKWVLRRAMSDVLPSEVAWRTDKSHLGGAFAKAATRSCIDQGEHRTSPPEFKSWVHLDRLQEACRLPSEQLSSATAAAMRTLLWSRRFSI